ncbi:potassium transporter KtrB [Fulvivirga sp. M361]|uniref:TrkH family potassium uptake protein n=1 Tax=Fulvivirga sp. M361 TaxID=2594266 RepID=UPI001179CFA0|nr:potassium transporter TrkG [Fulvivirga sp. M361]TRX60477.1 potassium transporter KtrB [Fulvivirga sp. M361]
MKAAVKNTISGFQPSTILILGYLCIMLIGSVLLSLSITQKENVAGIDTLFIVTSATSTTGLTSFSIVDHYNWFGQLIIMVMMQVGGIGYMSIASFIVIGGRKKLSEFNTRLLKTEFDLSEKYDLRSFVRIVFWFSLIIEVLGALVLYFIFKSSGLDQPVWFSLFHSISAYCTAGFSLFTNGFVRYSDNLAFNATITVLSMAGCIGFIVFVDLYKRIVKNTKAITFTSKIIFRFTFWILTIATFILFISESSWSDYPTQQQWLLAFFQTMTAVTTVGFNTVPIDELANASLFFITILMLSGASPAGTGGGIKSTTISAMFAITRCTLKGQNDVTFMGVRIPIIRLRMAVANFFFYFAIVGVGIFLLLLTETGNAYHLIFEAISALGTVGLSAGITGDLSVMGKLVVILLMFLGRIGALTFGLSLLHTEEGYGKTKPPENIAL